MPIRIDRFGGMVPKMDPTALPDNAAALAVNCDVTGGVLVPSSTPSANLFNLRNSDGSFIGDVDSTSATFTEKPTKPQLLSSDFIRPIDDGTTAIDDWLRIYAHWVITWSPTTSTSSTRGIPFVYQYSTTPLACTYTYNYTVSGLVLQVAHGGFGTKSFDVADREYKIWGPIYQFQFVPDINGGPKVAHLFPNQVFYFTPQYPSPRVPLYYDNNLYGEFQVAGATGVNWNYTFDVTYEPATWTETAGASTFRINLNYVNPVERTFFYVTTPVDIVDQSDPDAYREGTPSDISNEIKVPPGVIHKITSTITSGTTKPMNIYRSETGGDDFRMVAEKVPYAEISTGWQDDERIAVGDPIPPFGAIPDDLHYGYWHPAGFAVGYRNPTDGGGELWRSDLYREWVWPEENVLPFPEAINVIVMSGNSVIVFTDSYVYAVSGNDPERGTRTLLSSSLPLINRKSVCRIGANVYYSTYDGLAVANGSECKLISGGHFDRETWLQLGMGASGDGATDPVNTDVRYYTRRDLSALLDSYTQTDIEAQVADGKIYFGPLTFDLEEELAAVTANDGTSVSTWKSKVFTFEQPTTIDYVELLSTGTVTGTLYADDVGVGTVTNVIAEDNDVSLTTDAWVPVTYSGSKSVFAKRWQIDLTFDAIVRRLSIADRQVIDAQDVTVLTTEQVPAWKNIWLRFPNRGNFCAGSVKHQGGDSIPVYFTPGDQIASPKTDYASKVTGTASDKGLFYLDRDMEKSAYWYVKVDYPHRVDQLTLYRRQTEAVDGYQIREVNNGDVPPWRIKRYEFEGKGWPSAIEVHFSGDYGAIPVNLYKNGSATADPASTTVLSGNASRLDGMGAVDSLEFDFGVYDDIVDEVIVYADPAQLVGEEGVMLSDAKRFRGLHYKFPDRGRWALYSVWAEDYDDVTLNTYPDGSSTPTSYTVSDAKTHYFPFTDEYTVWEVDVDTESQVRQLMLVPWTRQQVDGNTISITARDTTFPPWRHTIWQFPKSKTLRSIWVDAEDLTDQLKMYLYIDGATNPIKYSIYPNFDYSMFRKGFPVCESLRIVFDAADEHLINHVRVHCMETAQGDMEAGYIAQDPPTWRHHHVQMPGSTQWACGVVRADDYTDLAVSITKGGGSADFAVDTLNPTSGDAVAFSRGAGESNEWVVDTYRLTQTTPRLAEPDYLRLVPWVEVPVEGGVIRSVKTDPALPPWMYQRYVFTDRQKLNTVLVNASSDVTMSIYLDGSSTAAASVNVTANTEYVLPTTLSRCQRVDFSFDDDDAVREVFVFTEQEAVIGDQGVSLSNPVNTRMIPVKFSGQGAWACGMIGTDYSSDQTVTLTLYRDVAGVRTSVHSQTISSGKPFAIRDTDGDPVLTRADKWWIDVDGVDVRSIVLIPWQRTTMQGDSVDMVRPENGIAPWLYTMWESEKRVRLTSWKIQHDSDEDITLTTYADDDSDEQTVGPAEVSEQLFDNTINWANEFYFHFGSDDEHVRAVHLFSQQVIPIEQQGIILREGENVRSWRKIRLAFPDVGSFTVARVVADGEVTLKLWCDGTLQNTWVRDTSTKQRREFTLMQETGSGDEKESSDMLDSGRHWDVDVICDKPIHELHLIGNTVTPARNGSAVIRKQEAPFTWLRRRIVSETPIRFNCARVVSESYPVAIRLYSGYVPTTEYPELSENTYSTDIKPGRGEYSVLKIIQNARPVRLPKTDPDGNAAHPSRVWTIDVVDWDNVNQFEDTYDASVGRPKYDAIIHEVGLATSMERLKQ